jgi:hypothetical protein
VRQLTRQIAATKVGPLSCPARPLEIRFFTLYGKEVHMHLFDTRLTRVIHITKEYAPTSNKWINKHEEIDAIDPA